MTQADVSNPWVGKDSPFGQPPAEEHPRGVLAHVESVLVRCSEWFNPILVKEARQALKSWQFVITFALLLMFGWGWSLMGVALLSPGVYFAPGGRVMLSGYTVILLIPMMIIVPFSAFRSLAAEREDGTYDLLSITTLNARQIVTGKLGSAILQMIVYYSALAPCIAFTYLLRGVDILTIVLVLFYAFLFSILLSAFGLLQATITRSWHWQALLAVSLILLLLMADILATYVTMAVILSAASVEFDNMDYWILQGAILTFYATFLMLLILAAASRISFASDNRSTKIRTVMFIQQLLWIFWMIYLFLKTQHSEVLYPIMPFAAIYWYLLGSMMTGEEAVMSPRVRRSLPQSFFGRMFLTWFNPGSDTGFVFVILNTWTVAMVVVGAAIAGQMTGFIGTGDLVPLVSLSTLAAAYVTIYLGIGRLFTLMLQRIVATGVVIPLLLQILLAAFGAFVPFVVGGWIQGFNDMTYTPLQVSNWFWTLIEAGDGDLWAFSMVPISIYAMAGLLLLVHLAIAFREVEYVRSQTPQRVMEDELLLHPERAIAPRRPGSPWDDEPASVSKN